MHSTLQNYKTKIMDNKNSTFNSNSLQNLNYHSSTRTNFKTKSLLSSIERSPVFRKRTPSRPRLRSAFKSTWKSFKNTSLIEEKQNLKLRNHKLKSENLKLKTRVHFLGSEISKRDDLVEQTLNIHHISIKPKKATQILKSSIVNNLK